MRRDLPPRARDNVAHVVGRGTLLLCWVVACGSNRPADRPTDRHANDEAKPVAIDAAILATDAASIPVDAPVAEHSIDELPAPLRSTLPTVSITGNEGLLTYVAARLDAPTGLPHRLATAELVARATITKSEVRDHAVKGLDHPAVRDGVLYVSVVEADVTWVRGRGGKTVKGVWPAPQEDDGTTAGLPAVGATGLLLLHKLPGTKLGKALGAAVKGAFAIDPIEPVLVPDDPRARLVVAKKADVPALAKRITGEDLDSLLVRATLFRLGARDAALAGFDAMTFDAAVLESINIVVLEKAGKRLGLSGPETTQPLP